MTTGTRSYRLRSGSWLPKAGRVLLLTFISLSAGLSVARADCQQDVGALMKRREAAVQFVNKAKAANGKLDAAAACPRLKSLNAVESEAVSYFQKNKDWCNLPDDLVQKMTDSAKRTAQFAGQACSFAVKIKQMQQQQAQQQQEALPKLPTGPL